MLVIISSVKGGGPIQSIKNFGHVISEALIGGCPVVISDQTPWRRLEYEGEGWDIELSNPEKYIQVLQYLGNYKNNQILIIFFANEGSVWGLATWRRTIEKEKLDYRGKEYVIRKLRELNKNETVYFVTMFS